MNCLAICCIIPRFSRGRNRDNRWDLQIEDIRNARVSDVRAQCPGDGVALHDARCSKNRTSGLANYFPEAARAMWLRSLNGHTVPQRFTRSIRVLPVSTPLRWVRAGEFRRPSSAHRSTALRRFCHFPEAGDFNLVPRQFVAPAFPLEFWRLAELVGPNKRSEFIRTPSFTFGLQPIRAFRRATGLD